MRLDGAQQLRIPDAVAELVGPAEALRLDVELIHNGNDLVLRHHESLIFRETRPIH